MKLPQILTNSEEFLIAPKDDDDVMMGKEGADKMVKANQLNVNVDWTSVLDAFNKVKKENLQQKVNDLVLQTKNSINPNVLKRYLDNTSREGFIKSSMVELMSTPEYQLC
jgi:ferredoxin-fold anticodon binding domain-containing protein